MPYPWSPARRNWESQEKVVNYSIILFINLAVRTEEVETWWKSKAATLRERLLTQPDYRASHPRLIFTRYYLFQGRITFHVMGIKEILH
jgi:hypothetical protein